MRAILRLIRAIFSAPFAAGVLVFLGLALIGVYAVWYTSAGMFPRFPQVTNYHADLGDAFINGQLSLLAQPDPRLAQLQNPYDNDQRKDIPYLWDISYFKGKYLLYWGPTPAVIFAAVQALTGIRPLNQFVSLFGYIGSACVLAGLLWLAWRRFYPRSPGISVVLFFLAGCVNLPYLFLLGRPQVYETAIITGQCFLFAGLLAWGLYFGASKRIYLALAGLAWGLAFAARMNLAFSVGVYLCFALYYLWRSQKKLSLVWKPVLWLLAPLAACVLAMGFYNFARFQNPLETGWAYQFSVPTSQKDIYALSNVPSNLAVHFLTPLSVSLEFPFVKSVLLDPARIYTVAALPSNKLFDEVFVSIPAGLPFFWLLLLWVPALGSAWRFVGRKWNGFSPRIEFLLMVAFAGGLQFAFLMVFFYGAVRYFADYSFALLLLAAFGAWELDERITWPILRVGLWLVTAVLIFATVTIGFFGAFDIPPQVFSGSNPLLYRTLADNFTQAFSALRHDPGLAGRIIRYWVYWIGFR